MGIQRATELIAHGSGRGDIMPQHTRRRTIPQHIQRSRMPQSSPLEVVGWSDPLHYQVSAMGETLQVNQSWHRSPEAGHCSFHDSSEHATLHCLVLKRHLENLVQRIYLDKFILELEEDYEERSHPSESTAYTGLQPDGDLSRSLLKDGGSLTLIAHS